jgi:hypothetical protein
VPDDGQGLPPPAPPVDAASSVFLGAEISPNFDLKNMNSTFTKDFSMKKMAQIHQISKKKSKSPDFYDEFQQVAKNIRRILVFFYFHI